MVIVPSDAESIVEIGDYHLFDIIRREGWIVSSRFPHRLVVALSPDGQDTYLAETEAWEVKRVQTQTGDLAELIRLAVPRVPVTGEMIREEREMWRERAGDRLPPSTYLNALDQFEVPDSLPGIDRMYVDQLGNVWVAPRTTWEVSAPMEYVILDPSGQWIANATVPEGMFIADISGDVIVARASGPLGEPLVRVHPIHK